MKAFPSVFVQSVVLLVVGVAFGGHVAVAQPLPEGYGISADHPNDKGISKHSLVVFTEDFESYKGREITWSEIGGWNNIYGDLVITREAADVHGGDKALHITHKKPQTHGAVKEIAGCDRLFVRYYMKVHDDFPGCHHTGMGIRGGPAKALFDNPTGTKPNGKNHFGASLDLLSPLHSWGPPKNDVSPGWIYNYCYHMDQADAYGDVLLPTGPLSGSKLLGPEFVSRPNVLPKRGKWYCYEIMLECNTLGNRDGRVAIWLDGRLVADHPNLKFRSAESIKARYVTLSTYSSQVKPNMVLWYDDIVVATNYIGPVAPTATKYTLEVKEGSGGGIYCSGEVANIVAKAAPAGKVFAKWTGDVKGVEDISAATTTMKMPSANVSLAATYKDSPSESKRNSPARRD